MVNLKDILYEGLSNYKKFRPYKHEEIEAEIDEYFANEVSQRRLPKMWKDRDDGRSSIKTAPYEFFDEQELRSIINTDVGEILDTPEEDRLQKAIEMCKKYGKNYKRIIDGIKKKVPFPPPIAIKDSEGTLYLLGGNSRLMLGIAMGYNLPVKVSTWKKKIQEMVTEVSTGDLSTADEGEPDTGFSPAGQTRILGIDDSKPEPWYDKGGYSQLSFPKADDPYGGRRNKDIQRVIVKKVIKNTGVKYDGFQDDVGSWDKYGDKDYSIDFDLEELTKMYADKD